MAVSEEEITVAEKCPDCSASLPIKVCHSGGGYYVGQWCDNCGPYCRLSIYYPTREAAQKVLDSGTYLKRDINYHKGE